MFKTDTYRKSNKFIYLTILFFSILFTFVYCSKGERSSNEANPSIIKDSTDSADDTTQTTDSAFNGSNLSVNISTCPNAPDYGDSIVYLKPKSGDFFVEPINNSGIRGTYLSWPEGLKLNRNTGAINLSQSETGVRYNIAFIKKGTTDTCVSQLIVGGLTYLDAIYALDGSDTLAKPVFNADPFASPVCNTSDDYDYPDNNGNGNSKCDFDDDLPGQRANDQKLRVRTISGVINLKKSVADGLFGKNPKNGDTKTVKIKYRLNDASQKAVQKLSVQVMYFDKQSNIPASLTQNINNKRASMYSLHVVNGKPRPPLLIIAGLAQ